LAATQQPADNIQIVSPVDGFILSRSISTGQRVDKGAEFYRIADLSHVWILADVYENEAQYFQPGTIATLTSPYQKRTFRARVSKVLPQFDPATRTMKLRLETDNPGFLLRPDMFVDVELPVTAAAGLTVPVDALLDSGQEKRVFVERGNGMFEPRRVETGLRLGDRVEVVSGLAAGDRVVISGTFLLDSESRLKTVAGRHHGPDDEPMQTAMPQLKLANNKSEKMPDNEKTTHAKDPTCGMDVDPAKATAAGNSVSYRGTFYYFCSSGCKDKFQKDPQRYLGSSHQGAAQ
jgi:membrane fusion protein, copper/silver efflux system